MTTPRARTALVVALVLAVLVGVGRCASDGDTDGTGGSGGAGAGLTTAPSTSSPAATSTESPEASPPPPAPPPPSSSDPPTAGEQPATGVDPLVGPARAALPTLEVKGRAPKTGYSREEFGQAWSDDVSVESGHNGCDTRNDILRRDLQQVVLKPGTRDCVVLSGVLVGPYTGERVEFERGRDTSSLVQIDHVVALSDAWQKGAQQLDPDRRRDLANDPLELLAVTGAVNRAKRDGDAATWLPPRQEARCGYVARQVLVKQRYGLWTTAAEHEAMERVLSGCG